MKYYILCIAKCVITKSWCFLRASGGVSSVETRHKTEFAFSPRKRRCFLSQRLRSRHRRVFSAQAEVFLKHIANAQMREGFLRASGGVSYIEYLEKNLDMFSPRKRRCFRNLRARHRDAEVFSAQAEVFLKRFLFSCSIISFLRASGGVSKRTSYYELHKRFSPRKRRCFFVPPPI